MLVSKQARRNLKSKKKTHALFRKTYERFLKIRGRPREIALGFALGIFFGMMPMLGVQMVVVFFLASLLKWSKISAAAGVWITNPLTAPFLYGLTYMTGKRLLGLEKTARLPGELNLDTVIKIFHQAPHLLWAMTVGGVVIGLPLAVLGYYISFHAVSRYQQSISKKLAGQKMKLLKKKERVKEKIRKRRSRKQGKRSKAG
ncbi:DUF2062 domain-containing protein [Acidobacteriota bacterium]